MSLIPYYLQYVSEICEGTRKAPAGIVLTEQEDLKKALQLQAEITKMGIPAFVKACAEADGTEIPQEEYDSFDPAELNTAIAQLAAASQPQEPAEEAPQEPVRTETRDIFEIFLDSVCLDDALLTYLIDILKRRSEPEFAKLSHAAARTTDNCGKCDIRCTVFLSGRLDTMACSQTSDGAGGLVATK